MCRKVTGTLTGHFLTFPPSQLSFEPSSSASAPDPSNPDSSGVKLDSIAPTTPAFKEYRSSPECLRGFCSNCGSTMTWRNTEVSEIDMDVLIGTLDKEWLEKEPQLAHPTEHYYCVNTIKGVSDGIVSGKKWKGMCDIGENKGEEWKEKE